MRRPLWIPWRWWRRAVQLALLVAFLWLFRRTEYTNADQLPGGENILFRLDPLVGITAMLGARQFISLFWPALVLVGLTMFFGRFFCGWVCPLGTLLDYFHRVVNLVKTLLLSPFSLWKRVGTPTLLLVAAQSACGFARAADTQQLAGNRARVRVARSTRYVILIAVLLAAVFAFPLVGFVDPFSLLVRGMTFWGDPMLCWGVDATFGWAGDGWATDVLQPFVKEHLLPFRPMVFHLAGVSAALLAAIFALEFVARRFWCRYLCPTGALLSLLACWSLVKRVPAGVCKNCSHCATICRMDALDPVAGLSLERCTLCMDCVDFCPKSIAKFTIGPKRRKQLHHVAQPLAVSQSRPVDLSRRAILTGIAAGVAIPGAALASRLGGGTSSVPPTLLRPPGAGDEKTFLNLCIRCGECMKVCPTNILQPTIFEAGLEGMFSPRMIPRFIFEQTFCEYSCTLCGQVCPTGAIPRLTEDEKHAQPTGKAYFDHSLCLPWAENTACIRCEEMCPAPEKAIKILNTFTIKDKDGADVEIQQPYVDRDLCVGCGICESNCTIPGVSAIRVQRIDAPDPGTETLLKPK